jgi:hypothetical protein
MRNLVGKKVKTVKVPFMGSETVEVVKLSVAQVREFQATLSKVKEDEADVDSGLNVQRSIIRMAVVGADDLTDDELDSFPMDDLSSLVQKILELAGVRQEKQGNA